MDRISAVKLWREVTNGLDVPTDRAVHMFAHLVSERETSSLRDAFEALKVAHAVVISGERERCAAVFVENGRAIGRAEEREACAKACESSELPIRCMEDAYANSFLVAAARKIRERSHV